MEINENQEEGIVTIDGYQFPGFVLDVSCPQCGQALILNEDYDAEFCPACNVWGSRGCGDPSCPLCENRPEQPLPVVEPSAV